MMSQGTINFITDPDYRWMSNFYSAPIMWCEGLHFPTVEHGFHYFKTNDVKWQTRILFAKTPGEAKRLGKLCPLREDWEDVKVTVMKELVTKKFEQHPDLTKKLLETGKRLIQEDAFWDSFWGIGRDGKGKNVMGKILSYIRRKGR